jgi:hypothetical protein
MSNGIDRYNPDRYQLPIKSKIMNRIMAIGMKKVFATIGISIAIASISPPATADEFSNYICLTKKNLVFVKENDNNQLIYTSFKGQYNSIDTPAKNPDLILSNGQRKLFDRNNKQSLVWKNGAYTYQIIGPTAKSGKNLSGYLVVKRNNLTISTQQCLSLEYL